ncbi:LuxR C-terminal-related transcriptional regulator [Treponema sp.]|uniref:LuxR C-terminal-related transcriptional regulator n=1 Tax=Treponema sp. TaxID=166 RepID=UPI00298DB525|nr:LuxR C-terminal-related transcriptional regulator [Treponema sp.]MCQ2241815.1 LuxR C-terminal-related transcriptional regulator [Treponema sp.]
MFKVRLFFTLAVCTIVPFFCYGKTNLSSSSEFIEASEVLNTTRIKSEAKIFRDDSNKQECSDIPANVFQKAVFPYYPGAYNGTIWLDIQIEKSEKFNREPFTLLIDTDYIDFHEAYISSGDSWKPILSKTYLSYITSCPLIPIIRDFYGENNIIHVRAKMRTHRGDPINVKIVPNNSLFKTTTKSLSWFYLSGGIGACIFFFILIIGILLKDPAYILLAFSALFYILKAMQAKNIIPVILWNHTAESYNSDKLEYIIDCFGILSIAFCAHYFSFVAKIKGSISKPLIAIIELSLIKILFLITIDSHLVLFISCTIISIMQNIFIIYTLLKNIINNNAENKSIFFCWTAVFVISTALRLIIIVRNYAFMPLPEFIKPNEMIPSTLGFLLLFVPPLYTIGRRFNIRFQYVQKEYQNLEMKFLNRSKIEKLTDTVSTPIAKLASSVLNSACILSKLNFSAVNAEYIELIKRESSKINDLLVAVRVLEGTEEIKETPILLLNFFNSCMMTIRRVAKECNCTASLTTAIANDTIISADPRILQLLFIITPTSIISLSKPNSKISIYIEEEEDDLFTMTIANRFDADTMDSPETITNALNEISYFDFLNELSKIYGCTMEISPLKESCRTKIKFHFHKMSDTSGIKVVTDKTTFEISDNSQRLFKDLEKNKSLEVTRKEKTEESSAPILQSKEDEKSQPIIKDIFDQFDFSTREKEIATLIIEGKSDKEIAFELNISPQTVATHNKKIFKKTGVHSRVELINKVR